MPSLRNRTFLITGATDGLGRGVAEHLAHDGATVLLHGRNAERLETAAHDIAAASAAMTARAPTTARRGSACGTSALS